MRRAVEVRTCGGVRCLLLLLLLPPWAPAPGPGHQAWAKKPGRGWLPALSDGSHLVVLLIAALPLRVVAGLGVRRAPALVVAPQLAAARLLVVIKLQGRRARKAGSQQITAKEGSSGAARCRCRPESAGCAPARLPRRRPAPPPHLLQLVVAPALLAKPLQLPRDDDAGEVAVVLADAVALVVLLAPVQLFGAARHLQHIQPRAQSSALLRPSLRALPPPRNATVASRTWHCTEALGCRPGFRFFPSLAAGSAALSLHASPEHPGASSTFTAVRLYGSNAYWLGDHMLGAPDAKRQKVGPALARRPLRSYGGNSSGDTNDACQRRARPAGFSTGRFTQSGKAA